MQIDLATTFMIIGLFALSILVFVLFTDWLDAYRKKHVHHSPH